MVSQNRRILLLAVGVTLIASSIFVIWYSFFSNREGTVVGPSDKSQSALSVYIKVLPSEERLRRENSGCSIPVGGLDPPLWWPRSFSIDYAENPLIMQNNYAVLIVRNDSAKALNAYSFLPATSCNGSHSTTTTGAFLIKMEIATIQGLAIEIVDPVQKWDPSFPRREDLVKRPVVTILPQGEQELRIPILANLPSLLDPQRGAVSEGILKQGVYKVNAVVSYAEAPSGEIKKIHSEPIDIVVSESHIQQAELVRLTSKEPAGAKKP